MPPSTPGSVTNSRPSGTSGSATFGRRWVTWAEALVESEVIRREAEAVAEGRDWHLLVVGARDQESRCQAALKRAAAMRAKLVELGVTDSELLGSPIHSVPVTGADGTVDYYYEATGFWQTAEVYELTPRTGADHVWAAAEQRLPVAQ